jgi:hypothetical protein
MSLNICGEVSLSNILLRFTLVINIVFRKTPSVSVERDKLFLMETSVAHTGFNTILMQCTMSEFCRTRYYKSNARKTCKTLHSCLYHNGSEPSFRNIFLTARNNQ